MIWWDEKSIPFFINLHKSKLYNMWSTLLLELGPGLLFTMHQLLNLTIQLQEIGARGMLIRVEFLYYDFPPF